MTVKCTVNTLNIGTPKIITVIVLKWNSLILHADGIANSVDPDQTAP